MYNNNKNKNEVQTYLKFFFHLEVAHYSSLSETDHSNLLNIHYFFFFCFLQRLDLI